MPPRRDEGRPAKTSWLQRSPRLLGYAIATLTAAVFATDLVLPVHSAVGALYAVPILFSLWLEKRRVTIAIAAVCVALTAATAFYHDRQDPLIHVIATRGTTMFSIAIATSLGLMRLRAERELGYVRNMALTTLHGLVDAVITISDHGDVRMVNESAERLLGRSRDELIGRRVSDVFIARDDEPKRPPIVELVERGATDVREATLFTLGGRRVPIEYTRTAIESAEGERYGEVIVFRDISARKEHEDAMRRMAYRDDLTGLPNRISLADRLTLELAHARRNRESLGVLYFDLDGFKSINDEFGHAAGDALLVAVGERLRASLRAGDTVARLGGDEFVVLLPGVAGVAEARRVGEKIIAALQTPVRWEGRELTTSASIGIALFPRDGDQPDTLLRRADKAMYRAKSLGRGRVELHRAGARDGA
jgi:diguanylate cyclase (GGDEF)-like protein/PAS domain S-box-containing protein